MKYYLILFLTCSQVFAAADVQQKKVVLILGDSLTEGYGIEKNRSFPVLLEKLLHQRGKTEIQVLISGVSGATTASGLQRLNRHLKDNPNILILALGANDGLRGFKVTETKKNLKEILRQAKFKNLKVLLAGMKLPPNYGQEYADEFEKMFRDLARDEKVALMPFLLEGVGGEANLNLEDGIHPNEKGHELVAKNLLKYLDGLL